MMGHFDELLVEHDNLMQLLGELRIALRTADDVDVREWAAQVADKAQRWDGVPWEAVDGVLFALAVMQHPYADDEADLRTWYDANYNPEV